MTVYCQKDPLFLSNKINNKIKLLKNNMISRHDSETRDYKYLISDYCYLPSSRALLVLRQTGSRPYISRHQPSRIFLSNFIDNPPLFDLELVAASFNVVGIVC
jgi:hypothetical protein